MKKAIITIGSVVTGLLIGAPVAMAETTGNLDSQCSATFSGFTPGETVDFAAAQYPGAPASKTFTADTNGNVNLGSADLASAWGAAIQLTGETSGHQAGGAMGYSGSGSGSGSNQDKQNYLNNCAANNTSAQPTQDANVGTQAVAPAQDNTVTDITAGVATSKSVASNNSEIALAGIATLATVSAGTLVIRKKKA
ncbi:MAG: hypothetical protein QM571_03080 [Micrococcaceae bacterium]